MPESMIVLCIGCYTYHFARHTSYATRHTSNTGSKQNFAYAGGGQFERLPGHVLRLCCCLRRHLCCVVVHCGFYGDGDDDGDDDGDGDGDGDDCNYYRVDEVCDDAACRPASKSIVCSARFTVPHQIPPPTTPPSRLQTTAYAPPLSHPFASGRR